MDYRAKTLHYIIVITLHFYVTYTRIAKKKTKQNCIIKITDGVS